MRLLAARVAFFGLAAAAVAVAAGCVPVQSGTVDVVRLGSEPVGPGYTPLVEIARADPEEVAERALIGGILGAALGTGLGATFAINPGLGAVIGVQAGAVLGNVVGVMTAQPLPSYVPVPVPAAAVIPRFYDTWPPGHRAPVVASMVPPPPPSVLDPQREIPAPPLGAP